MSQPKSANAHLKGDIGTPESYIKIAFINGHISLELDMR
jgi:hypothetical protein